MSKHVFTEMSASIVSNIQELEEQLSKIDLDDAQTAELQSLTSQLEAIDKEVTRLKWQIDKKLEHYDLSSDNSC